MKIAFINQPWNYAVPPVQSNSVPILTYQLARRLARSCDVIVYARKGSAHRKVEWDDRVQYRRVSLGADLWVLPLLTRSSPFRDIKRPYFTSSLYYLAYVLKIAHDLRKQHCDIIHVHSFVQFVPIIRAFNPDATIVLHMHCEWLTQLDRSIIEGRLRQADGIVGCSEFITKQIRRRFPYFAERCHTVLNGADTDHFRPEDHCPAAPKVPDRLLFVGRVCPEKGVHVLLEAFQRVAECYPQAVLDIVGPNAGSPLEFLALSGEEWVSEMAPLLRVDYLSYLRGRLPEALAGKVRFTGFVPHTQLNTLYRQASVFVNPTFAEALGMSMIEAMASQLPVVSTRVGGVPEVVDNGKTGILVPAGDASALAEAICRLLGDTHLRESMGEAARKRAVDFFSWEEISDSLLRFYKNICPNNR